MISEYAQIASYLQSSREHRDNNDLYNDDPLPSYLRPSFATFDPFGHKKEKSGLAEDFIMVAEFSELEGPKPVMTIPQDGGSSFDQNTFAVKILAVDHQHSTEGFSITEDAQVVYSDSELGVYAFVHHLVLFDNTARGFVRPYCVAYVTGQQRKVMEFYEEISWQLKKAARYFKYGNRMVFVSDLERHLKDLDHTKAFFLNQVSKMRLKDTESSNGNQDARKNAEVELYKGLQTIRQSNLEILEILSILKPLLSDRKLEARFKLLEDRAFQNPTNRGADNLSLQEDWYNDLSSLNGLDTRYGSLKEPRVSPLTLFKPKDYKPHLVETKKAKRFNSALRGLHELCSWGAKEGITKLRSIHQCFKRDMMLLMLDRNESQMKYPSLSTVCHADCMTGNFLSGPHMNGATSESNCNTEDSWLGLGRDVWQSVGSIGSFDSMESFKSADSLAMFEGSPSSAYTCDSHVGNKFQSAPSSPRRDEISLLMENEYYSDLETSQNNDDTLTYQPSQRCDSGSVGSDTLAQPEHCVTPVPDSRNCGKGEVKRSLNTRAGSLDVDINSVSVSLERKACLHSRVNVLEASGSLPYCSCSEITGSETSNSGSSKKNSLDNRTSATGKLSCSKTESLTDSLLSKVANSQTLRDSYTSNEPVSIEAKDSEGKQFLDADSGIATSETSEVVTTTPLREKRDSLLSTLIAEEEAAAELSLENAGTLRASPFRPQTPGPHSKSGPDYHRQGNTKSSSGSSSRDSGESVERGGSSSSSSHQTSLILTHHLASLGGIKVRADSDASSVFTEISSQDLFPHLLGPATMSPSSSYSKDYSSTQGDDNNEEFVNVPAEISSPWRPKCGLASVGDWISNIGHGRPGYCILDVLTNYHNMQHVIASLLTGRPVLICGAARCEAEVHLLVNALSIFVGSVRRRRHHTILEWTLKPPRIPDLTRLRLVGVCRPDKRSLKSFIPSAVRQTCSIIDVEKRTIMAPQYQGQFITALLSKKKVFKADAQMLSYIQWWLMDIMGKAFVFYHSFCLASAGSIIYSQSAKDQRDSYCRAVSNMMHQNSIRDTDKEIIEHLAELVKQSQVIQATLTTAHNDRPIPLRLHHKVCQTFRC